MTELEIRPGDVVAVVAPDGTRRRYLASTLIGADGPGTIRYELSDHCEGSSCYDAMLDERTTIVLRWADA